METHGDDSEKRHRRPRGARASELEAAGFFPEANQTTQPDWRRGQEEKPDWRRGQEEKPDWRRVQEENNRDHPGWVSENKGGSSIGAVKRCI